MNLNRLKCYDLRISQSQTMSHLDALALMAGSDFSLMIQKVNKKITNKLEKNFNGRPLTVRRSH